MLADALSAPLQHHLEGVRVKHQRDIAAGYGRVTLSAALDRKYPNAATEWLWQFVFPVGRICKDPKCGAPSRFHLHESAIQRAVTVAARQAGVKRVSCHTFRHSNAAHLIRPARSVRSPSLSRSGGECVAANDGGGLLQE
jgi:integrase